MKRDLELIRKILLVVEAKPDVGSLLSAKNMNLTDWSIEEVNYHLLLLDEAGYLDTTDLSSDNESDFYALRLTWAGHEFLDAARDDTRWNKAKNVMGNVGTFTLDILKKVLAEIALQSARSALGLPPA